MSKLPKGNAPDKPARRAGEVAKEGYKRGREGLVVFITSDKIIQAILTGAVTSVVFSFNEGIAAYVQLAFAQYVPVYIPVKIWAAFGAVLVVIGAYWADRHTEEWREYVRDKTGEDVSEDTAAEEDVTGEEKGG